MLTNFFLTSRSIILSVLLHVMVGIVLIYSFDFSPKPTLIPKPIVNIVKANAVDKNQVDLELKRLRKKDNEKIEKELKRQKKIKKKAEDAKKKKLAKEKLKKLKKRKEKKEEKARKLAIEKKKKETKQKKKEEKIKLEQENKKKKEEKARKLAIEKKKEEKRKREEKILQEQLDAELEAKQQEHDLTVIQKYQVLITREVTSNFNKLNLPDGLECVILIRMLEGGKVFEASIEISSGNDLFDRRATNAVYSASPLPVPEETRLFEKMRTIRFTFDP
jgi:colicin import membrane protein